MGPILQIKKQTERGKCHMTSKWKSDSNQSSLSSGSMQSPLSLTSSKKTQILILLLARKKAGNSPVEEWVHSVLNGKYVLTVTSNALHAAPNLPRGWIPKVDLKAIPRPPPLCSKALCTHLSCYTQHVALSALSLSCLHISPPRGSCSRAHTLPYISFGIPSTQQGA